MRISDWSSDVCSSDLIGGTGPVIAVGADMGDCAAESRHAGHDDRIRRRAERIELHIIEASRREGKITDRKSGVSGKSVAGRVVLGGSGIHKTTKYVSTAS